MLDQIGVFLMDLWTIIFSPEYGAEALKVGAVYFFFRKDIKGLGEKIIALAKQFSDHAQVTDERIIKIETHLGLLKQPSKDGEGKNNGN